jgi:hypothetical protein
MPCIAQIPGGIKIEMYPADHHPPHFHAIHAEDEALFRIVDLMIFKGSLPAVTETAVRAWAGTRQQALAFNWVLCVDRQNPRAIP